MNYVIGLDYGTDSCRAVIVEVKTVTNCHGLKMQAADNNMRMTVAAAARQKLELESGKKLFQNLMQRI